MKTGITKLRLLITHSLYDSHYRLELTGDIQHSSAQSSLVAIQYNATHYNLLM